MAVHELQEDEKKYEDDNEDEENLPPVNLKRYNSSSVAFSPNKQRQLSRKTVTEQGTLSTGERGFRGLGK